MDDERVTVSAVAALRGAGAAFGYLHGSRVDGAPRPDSDLDVAAHFGGRSPAAWQVPVPPAVDLVVLDDAPLYLAGRAHLRDRHRGVLEGGGARGLLGGARDALDQR